MVFKNFRLNIIVRVLLLTLCLCVFAWCIAEERYLRSVYLAAAAIILVTELVIYVDRFNRDIRLFMQSILQRDYITQYQGTKKGKSFSELHETLNQISEAFRKISAEKEIQLRYLEMLVEHLRVGILSFDSDEKIHLVNQAMKDLLQKNVVTNLKSLETIDRQLVTAMREIHTGETKLVKVTLHDNILQLALHASEFKLDNNYYKLISMQNIRTELDAREMEAWQKLIRVLSHEIMNSTSPITSLSATLHDLVKQHESVLSTPGSSLYPSLDKGLDAIRTRAEGLYNFTQTYRKLTGIPVVSLQQTNLKAIVDRVHTLLLSNFQENNIQLIIDIPETPVTADPQLMEHVFINLLLNAIEAVTTKTEKIIQIKSSVLQTGRPAIHIIDNGEGIDEQHIERIFIPFFTTRKNGSGIGLAITRQILQLHQGDIRVKSELGKGTEFTIVL